jgi:hypothetical protein
MKSEIPKLLRARIDELESEISKSIIIMTAASSSVESPGVKGHLDRQIITNTRVLTKGVSV